jgi:hypothetical protein
MLSRLPAAVLPGSLAPRHPDADRRHGACEQQPRHDDQQHASCHHISCRVNPREIQGSRRRRAGHAAAMTVVWKSAGFGGQTGKYGKSGAGCSRSVVAG